MKTELTEAISQFMSKDEQRYLEGPIVFNGHCWASAVPKKIIRRIPEARLEVILSGSRYVSYEEYLAVLMTASFEAPINPEYLKIYMCVGIEWARKMDDESMLKGLLDINKNESYKGIESLNDWETQLMNEMGLKIRKAVCKKRKTVS